VRCVDLPEKRSALSIKKCHSVPCGRIGRSIGLVLALASPFMGTGMRPNRAIRAVVVAGALLGRLVTSSDAQAWCRTTTSPVPADFDPAADSGCWTQGLPLFWRNACVSYDIVQGASTQITYEEASSLVGLAFTRWTSTLTYVPFHGVGKVSIAAHNLGPVSCDKVEFNKTGGPNQNAIIFRDDYWGSCPPPCPQYSDPTNTLALTTVSFDPTTGELLDADMEINTFQHRMTTSPVVPPDSFDFLSVVTHETGHFLGLAHSADAEATMYWNIKPGTTHWDLTPDDVAGISNIYPPDGTRAVALSAAPGGTLQATQCDPTPLGGFTPTCDTSMPAGCGSSSIAPAGRERPASGAHRDGAWAGLIAAVLIGAARRRRAR